MQSFWLYLPPVHRSLLKESLKYEFQNLLFCVLRRKPSRSQYFTIEFVLFFVPVAVSTHVFVSFVTISFVLCRCFKAMFLVRILP